MKSSGIDGYREAIVDRNNDMFKREKIMTHKYSKFE